MRQYVRDQRRAVAARLRQLERHDLIRRDRAPELTQRDAVAQTAPATGAKTSRPWKVALIGSRHSGESPMSTPRLTPPSASAARPQQPVVGADENAISCDAQRDRTSLAADAGIDDREMHARRAVGERRAQRQRARADVVARDAVVEIDDARARAAPRDHRVADADELVREAVVRQERDRAACSRASRRVRQDRVEEPVDVVPCGFDVRLEAVLAQRRARYRTDRDDPRAARPGGPARAGSGPSMRT